MGIFETINNAIEQYPIQTVIFLIGIPLLAYVLYSFISMRSNPAERQMQAILKRKEAKSNLFDNVLDTAAKYLGEKGNKIQLDLEKSNIIFSKNEYLTILVVGILGGAFVGATLFPFSSFFVGVFGFLNAPLFEYALGRLLAAITFGFLGYYTPRGWVIYKKSQRSKLIVDQVEDAFLIFADSLRSGTNIEDALGMVGREMKYPLGTEFARAHSEMQAGKSFVNALNDLKERVDMKDFDMAINAIQIQHETGGSLETLLREMVKMISERKILRKEIEKIVAESKLTGFFLMGAPIVLGGFLAQTNKEGIVAMFASPLGWGMAIVAAICYIIGSAIIISGIMRANKLTK